MADYTLGQLWQAFRGAENTLRYFGDFILGVIQEFDRDSLEQDRPPEGSDFKIPGLVDEDLKDLWAADPNMCDPTIPPCEKTIDMAIDEMEGVNDKIGAMIAAMRGLREHWGPGGVIHYPTEIPGAGNAWGRKENESGC